MLQLRSDRHLASFLQKSTLSVQRRQYTPA